MTGASPAPTRRASRAEAALTQNAILELIIQNASLTAILGVVTSRVERQIPGSRASILLLDDDGRRVRVAAAPSIPPDYSAAIDGTAIGPNVGTCGTAAYEKRVVITTDIEHDPAWTEWAAVARSAGFAACWSTPFLGRHGRVLGTFAVYFGEPRAPAPGELGLLHDAGFLAAVAVQHDRVHRELRDTSRTNPVTGLPNRAVLNEELQAVQARSALTHDQFAVIHVSVLDMGAVNDSLGPLVGDAVLRAFADRLATLVPKPGLVSHVWGCDFVVLIGALSDAGEGQALAESLRDALLTPYAVDGLSVELDVLLGLAGWGGQDVEGTRPFDEPLRAAGVALERAKRGGFARIGIYDPDLDPGADVAVLGPALRRGLDEEEFTLAYQPVVALADERVDHYEALLRWATGGGAVPPESFVPVAEQTGLVTDLGRYALERALAELRHQRTAGRDIGMSVNLSVRQLADDDLPQLIARLVAEHAVPPASLTMEVTEGVLLTASGRGWQALERIRAVGVRIALDDFGAGFSQIGYLRRFRFDELKLDRTLVRDMHDDVTAHSIILGALAFARAADLPVVAEGIERRAQADELRDLGCAYGQGYLFGPPGPTAAPAGATVDGS